MTVRRKGLLLVGMLAFVWGWGRACDNAAAIVSAPDFNRDVRPILSDNCFQCHGPDASARQARLRLDTKEGAFANAGVIVPGKAAESRLIQRIAATDPGLVMPPPDSGHKLTAAQIETLTRWVDAGAPWGLHWAFSRLQRSAIPRVGNRAWPRNPIDSFVLARLEQEGLQPSPEADRATLLRRASFDLTGLPPTPGELDAFLKDASPNAYEKVVDRLLASPRYGERMAFRWMDAARYSDSHGYQRDGDRAMWRWRDWVIDAFNRNMRFDQFTIEQLAGDLLPNATLEQRIATGFNRNHRANSEGGIVPAEYFVEYVVDRVDTTATVFMGLTAGCARCHNHKYDPFTQREYYQLSAFFNSIPEDGRASNYGNSTPWISAPTVEQQQRMKRLEQRIALTERQLAASLKTNVAAQRRWEQSLQTSAGTHWFPKDNLLVRHSMDGAAELEIVGTLARINVARPDDEENEKPRKQEIKKDESGFRNGQPKSVVSPTGQGAAFDGKLYFDAGKVANFDYRDRKRDYKDNFAVSVWMYPEADQSGAIVTHMNDNVGETDYGLPKHKGWSLFFHNGKLHFNVVSVWADDSFRVETADKLALNQWHHVVAMFNGSESLDKVKIFVNGREAKLNVIHGRLFRTFGDANRTLKFGGGGGPAFRFKGRLDEIRIYKALPEADEIAVLANSDSLQTIAAIPAAKRTRAQQLKLRGAFLESAAPAEAKQLWQQLAELKGQRLNLESEFSTLMVMQETAEPRPAYVLRRGAYDQPAEQVGRAVPAVLPPLPAEFPNNRLGLARWLVSKENPLTARVQVNRFWQMLFGTGLVKTVEDFGSQGELPSHPELLDWLAAEFRDGEIEGRGDGGKKNPQSAIRNPQSKAWDVKAMLKLMVMSATYRQSSKASAELLQRDVANRLLARGPRLRLSAEMIRDQALAASGLLVERLGGPSVKPYQPDGLWKDMTFSNMTFYDQSKGEDLWRRSLYSHWKRTILNPAMLTFDASARELCTVREVRTNTPLQALNLMNDVTYVEAARMLAERAMLEATTSRDRVTLIFRRVLARIPAEAETERLLKSFQSQLDHFRANPDAANRLLAIGEKRNDPKLNVTELAAYAMTASLILNLDEAITKQ